MRPSGEKERSLDGIVACVAAAMLFAAIYVGAYLALSEPTSFYGSDASGVVFTRVQSFRYGGSLSEPFFWPLTQVDMVIRPNYWRWEEPSIIPIEDASFPSKSSRSANGESNLGFRAVVRAQ
ncbi:MAG TPA: hypothetical protein VGN57_18440 [Pirellulaceae bacterium]|jgi:hypothetical protein|nr:hypothetical protein [Pirellulaceae bacterium]